MHIVLVYRYYNDGIVYYNLTFCTRKSLMTDLGLNITAIIIILFYYAIIDYFFSTGTAYQSPVSFTSLRPKLAG